MVQINGRSEPVAGQTLTAYLLSHSYDPQRLAVEINEAIVPKRLYGETVLQDGDRVEIVSFVGGG